MLLALASFVFAADPTPASAPAVAPVPRTIWIVSGTSDYASPLAAGQTLSGTQGATEDCRGIVEDLTAFGYLADQIVSFCGNTFLRRSLIDGIKGLTGRVNPGDTVIAVELGHGGEDPANDPGQTYWQPYDGKFPIDVGDTGSGYVDTGLTPRTFEGLIRGVVPNNTAVTFFMDTARGGSPTYNGINLFGPTAADFTGFMTPTFAFSPVKNSGKPGLIREVLRTCLSVNTPQASDGQVNVAELEDCVANYMSTALVPLSAASPAPEVAPRTTPLVWLPPKPVVAEVKDLTQVLPKLGPVRVVQRWGGLGVCLASSIGGFVTYGVASSIEADVEKQNFEVPLSMRDDIELHDTLVPTTYSLWALGGIGCASFGSSFVDFKVAPTQNGIAVAVSTSF